MFALQVSRALIVTVLLSLVALTACGPTPNEPAVKLAEPPNPGPDAVDYKIESEPLAIRCKLEAVLQAPDGRLVPAPLQDGGALTSGDGFAISFRANRECYVYAILLSSDGSAAAIFPYPGIEPGNRVMGGRWYRIPNADARGKAEWYRLDDHTGLETIHLLAGDEPLDNIAELVASLRGSQAGASTDILQRMLEHRYVTKTIRIVHR